MGFSERLLGKKNVNGGPHIESVSPVLALAGGEVRIAGSGLRPQQYQRPRVQFGEVEGGVVISSDSFLVARVPEGATSGPVESSRLPCQSVWTTEIGEIRTSRPPSQPPVSTVR